MARPKKTDAAKAAELEAAQASGTAEESIKAEEKAAEAKKGTGKKPGRPAKSAAEKTAAKTTAEKAPAKTASSKAPTKRAAKAAGGECVMHIQFAGKSYTQEELVKIAKDVWQFDLEKKAEDLENIELYVKPEESKVYYVMNGETGDFVI